MKIVAAGGGSGGHVTPVLAVLNELKKHDANLEAYFVTDRKFGQQAGELVSKSGLKIELKKITAGKFRRYHNLSVMRQLLDLLTTLHNIFDILLVGIGYFQSLIYLARIRPDVVFTKGGFVCLPLGLAAKTLKIPLVIHDSDAHAGLTNRVLSRWAQVIATGAPLDNYNYPPSRTHYVGIPVDSDFHPIKTAQQIKYKAELGLHDLKKPLVVITGGGLGARNINRAVVTVAPQILDKVAILHITGTGNYNEIIESAPEHVDYLIRPFVAEGMSKVIGAADVVVTRAGATTLQELAAMAKPTIIVPNQLLTGGHQIKNAAVYQRAKAAVVLDENKMICDPSILKKAIYAILGTPQTRQKMGETLHTFAKPEAATDMAALIVETAATRKHQMQG